MKKTAMFVIAILFLFNISCGSSTSSSDTTPREAKIIALAGTLMAVVANNSASRLVYDEAIDTASGEITTPLQKTYSEIDLEGTDDDIITVDSGSWSRTEASGVTTIVMSDLTYNSEMIEYPWNNTTPLEGAVINFDNIDYTVSASTDATKITGSHSITLTGTGTLSDLTPTHCSSTNINLDIGTMTVNILSPEVKSGTVTFDSSAFSCGASEGRMMTLTVLTANVSYEGEIYSCSIIAGYEPTIPGNTGIGELTISSATCTLE